MCTFCDSLFIMQAFHPFKYTNRYFYRMHRCNVKIMQNKNILMLYVPEKCCSCITPINSMTLSSERKPWICYMVYLNENFLYICTNHVYVYKISLKRCV